MGPLPSSGRYYVDNNKLAGGRAFFTPSQMEGEAEKTFLGRWRSGRAWKTPETLKASKKAATTGVKGHSWTEKMAQRQQAAVEKALLQGLREGREARQQV